jgi:small multidrug resistance family-3 protein
MTSVATYAAAALAEIGGCFAFWAWLRLGKSAWWTGPGVAALVLFAILLTRIDSGFTGRAYAAYGGVYIAASLTWLGHRGAASGPLGSARRHPLPDGRRGHSVWPADCVIGRKRCAGILSSAVICRCRTG